MKRYLICFLLSSFFLPVMAQEDYVDQLVNKGIEMREMRFCEESMLIYFEMAHSYASMNNMEKSIECAEKAMVADDGSQELLYLWMFIISACETINKTSEKTEETDLEKSAGNSRQIDQIH